MVEVIKSTSNSKIKDLVRLAKERKLRNEQGLFIVEGVTLVREALTSEYRISSFFYTKEAKEKYEDLVKEATLNAGSVYEVSEEVAVKISTLNSTQGMFLVLQKKADLSLDILPLSERVVLLECINDPTNLGAIARSALAFGFNTLVLSPDSTDFLSMKSLRASMGALLKLDVIVTPIERAIVELSDRGYNIYAAAIEKDATELVNVSNSGLIAIVIGNEANGLKKETVSLCKETVVINTDERVKSLNAAVAASILMYSLRI